MLKVLGLADIMAGLIFMGKAFLADLPPSMIIFFAAYLLIKGGIFAITSFDWISVGDMIGGIFLAISIFFHPPTFLLMIFAAFLFQKGFLGVLT